MNARMRQLGTIAYIVLVAFVIFVGVRSTFNAHDANRQAAAAIQQNGVLVQQLKDQQHDQAAREAADAIERQQMLSFETDLLGKYSDLLGKYNHIVTAERQLLRYLRRHGIAIPTRFVTVPKVVRLLDAPHEPKTSKPTPHSTPVLPAPTKAPPPTLPNGKPAPGNSGNAPGHIKH